MPELNPNLSQVEAGGAVGGVSPNLEAIGALGRGVERFGQDLSQTGEVIHKKVAQEEVSNVYADMATAREKWTDNLQEAARTGQLDTEDFKQKLQDDIQPMGDNLSTSEGRNFFTRQQARLQGYMLQKATHVKASITANQTVDDVTTAVNTMSNTALKDPLQFPDLIDKNEEAIQSFVDSGSLPAVQADKFRREMNAKIADGAAKGWAQMDPGKDASGKPNPNFLTQMLAHRDANGQGPFDQYLDADHISQLQNYAKAQDSARHTAEEQSIRLTNEAETKRQNAVLTQVVPQIFDNTFKATDIPKLNLPLPKAMEVLGAMNRVANEENPKRDPRLMNQLAQDINTGKINDEGQLLPHVGNGLDPAGYKTLRSMLADTPEGEANKTNRSMLLKVAESRLVKGNAAMGMKDPDGEQNLFNFTVALQQQEAQLRQSGKSPMDLYNPNAKSYFGNQLGKYELTPAQLMEKMAGGNTQDNVTVKDKDGKMFTMPRANLEKAKAKGYEEAK